MNAATIAVQLPVLFVTLVLGILGYLIPVLTRPSIYFAVTVDPSFRHTPNGLGVLHRYRWTVAAGTLLGLVLALKFTQSRQPFLAGSTPFLVVLFAMAFGFFIGRRQVLSHAVAPTSQRAAAVTRQPTPLPGGAIGQIGPFLILAAAAGWLAQQWDKIPARFPVHWGITGQPDAWATRTPAAVFGPLVLVFLNCLILAVIAFGLTRWSRRIHATGAASGQETHFRRLVMLLILAAEYVQAVSGAWAGLLPATGLHPLGLVGVIILGATTLLMTILVVFLVRAGQGGARLAATPPEESSRAKGTVGDRSEDRFWKAGLFYVNSDDPAILVEKRFGIGYTLNFGNPRSWLLLAVILVPCAVGWFLVPH